MKKTIVKTRMVITITKMFDLLQEYSRGNQKELFEGAPNPYEDGLAFRTWAEQHGEQCTEILGNISHTYEKEG